MEQSYQFIVADESTTLALIVKRVILRHYPDAMVLTFPDGLQALEAYDQAGASLLVTNRWMPRMGGLALINALGERGSRVPIIGVCEDDETYDTFGNAGVTAYIRGTDIVSKLGSLIHHILAQQDTTPLLERAVV